MGGAIAPPPPPGYATGCFGMYYAVKVVERTAYGFLMQDCSTI